jgi:hypothetical protein
MTDQVAANVKAVNKHISKEIDAMTATTSSPA